MLKCPFRFLIVLPVILLLGCQSSKDPASFVNPFVGTDFNGHTFPGATTPFGMVQLSPDTRIDGSWAGCSGYHYSDSVIYGFSHTHLSGTGVSDYGDILLMPQVGEPSFDQAEYASAFSHQNERAEPGYYAVDLDNGVEASFTVTPRVGMHHYEFPDGKASIIIDLTHRDHALSTEIDIIDAQTLAVGRRSRAWAQDQHAYGYIVLSEPVRPEFNTDSSKVILHLEEGEKEVLVKVGLSFTGVKGAQRNLERELPHWDFNQVKEEAKAHWNEELGKIEASDQDEEKLRTFYTALYHTMIHPNIAMDVGGRYRGMDGELYYAEGFDYYTVFSLWDTFRAAHPLFTIIDRKRTLDFIRTFLAMYEQGGRLPVWELCGNETDCMIGYHSVSVIADAMAKRIDSFDHSLALEAMVKSATWDHFGLPAYSTNGFIAVGDEHESVSKTLEYAYDDWCIAQVAGWMEKDSIQERFVHRSNAWRNLLDPETKLMRPRVNGGWLTPFDPRQVNNHFTEGNAWQYSFFVPQDVEGMIEAMEGPEQFEQKLDALFEAPTETTGRTQADITGLIGQYAHGNEPSHHMAYLYNYIDRPEKTTARVHQILSEFYTPDPDGLIGNEDCGQMSAWYVMSALGIYALTPGNPTYALTEPFLDDYVVHLENGQTFSRQTIEQARKEGNFISHTSLTGYETRELSTANDFVYVQPPIINAPAISFDDSMRITIEATRGDSLVVRPSLKELGFLRSESNATLSLRSSTTVEAYAYRYENGRRHLSSVVSGRFYKHPHPDWKVSITGDYNPQYNAGGDEGLIDGIRGDENWRKGFWQGYQDQDFEAVIQLDKRQAIAHFSASFLQDTRSWILMPTRVEFYVSDNGEVFKKVGAVKNTVDPENYEVQTKEFTLDLDAGANTRFIKVVAQNFGTLPEWHQGSGGEAFIFVDEITLKH